MINVQMITDLLVFCTFRCKRSDLFTGAEKIGPNLFTVNEKVWRKDQLKLGSVNTASNYVEYMQNRWLIFTVNCYVHSIKRRQVLPKKVYAIDTGLINAVGFSFSPNTGKLMENAIFLALRRQTRDLYYLQTKAGYEVDFYLPGQRLFIQVAQQMENPATRERELRAIAEASHEFAVEHALILSASNENSMEINGIQVQIRSMAEWLLGSTI